MKRYFMYIGLIFTGLTMTTLLSAPLYAASAANGKALHDKKCTSCHDTRQYTRPNRIVHTLEDLHARVEFCDSVTNANFSFDELDDVVEHLNVNFYKFKK